MTAFALDRVDLDTFAHTCYDMLIASIITSNVILLLHRSLEIFVDTEHLCSLTIQATIKSV